MMKGRLPRQIRWLKSVGSVVVGVCYAGAVTFRKYAERPVSGDEEAGGVEGHGVVTAGL
jgi:hypothetical protein